MQRFLYNPPSRAIAPVGGPRHPAATKMRHYASRKARWVKRSTFNCTNGQWTGEPFEIDSTMVMMIAEYMAINDGEAAIRLSARADGSESRLSFEVHVPYPTRVGRA